MLNIIIYAKIYIYIHNYKILKFDINSIKRQDILEIIINRNKNVFMYIDEQFLFKSYKI